MKRSINTPLACGGIVGLPVWDSLPGGQWAVGVYLKEWLFLSDQRRGAEGSSSLTC